MTSPSKGPSLPKLLQRHTHGRDRSRSLTHADAGPSAGGSSSNTAVGGVGGREVLDDRDDSFDFDEAPVIVEPPSPQQTGTFQGSSSGTRPRSQSALPASPLTGNSSGRITDMPSRLSGWFNHAFGTPSATDMSLPALLSQNALGVAAVKNTSTNSPRRPNALLNAAKHGQGKIMRYLTDSDSQPDKCPDPIWVMGVLHPGYEAPPPPSPRKSGRESMDSQMKQRPFTHNNSSLQSLSSQSSISPSLSAHWPPDFYLDYTSRVWCSYRSGFSPLKDALLASLDPPATSFPNLILGAAPAEPPPVKSKWWGGGEKGWTSDSGWGCMLRTGQSLLANALIHVHLGRDWRRPLQPSLTPEYAAYVHILTWFLDNPSPHAPFGIHRMALAGRDLGKEVGQWFGPSTAAGAIKRLVEAYPDCGLAVVVASDSVVFESEVFASSWSPPLKERGEEGGGEVFKVYQSANVPIEEDGEGEKESGDGTGEDVDIRLKSSPEPIVGPPPMTGGLSPSPSGILSSSPSAALSPPPSHSARSARSRSSIVSDPRSSFDDRGSINDAARRSRQEQRRAKAEKERRSKNFGDRPVLIVAGLRLGLEGINPIYWDSLKTLFTFPQSVGIAGGRPSSSYYFVGSQANNLFYLDPHHPRPSVPLRPYPPPPADALSSLTSFGKAGSIKGGKEGSIKGGFGGGSLRGSKGLASGSVHPSRAFLNSSGSCVDLPLPNTPFPIYPYPSDDDYFSLNPTVSRLVTALVDVLPISPSASSRLLRMRPPKLPDLSSLRYVPLPSSLPSMASLSLPSSITSSIPSLPTSLSSIASLRPTAFLTSLHATFRTLSAISSTTLHNTMRTLSSLSSDDGNDGRTYRRPRMSLRAMTTARLRDALVSSRFGDVLMNVANSTRLGNAVLAATTSRLDMMMRPTSYDDDGYRSRPRSNSAPADAYGSFVKIDKRDFAGYDHTRGRTVDDDDCQRASVGAGASPSSSAGSSPSTTYTLLGADDFSNARMDDFPNFPTGARTSPDAFVGLDHGDDADGDHERVGRLNDDDDIERSPRSPSPAFSSPVIIHSSRPSFSSLSDDDGNPLSPPSPERDNDYFYPPPPTGPIASSSEYRISSDFSSPVSSSTDDDLASSPVNVSPLDVFSTPLDAFSLSSSPSPSHSPHTTHAYFSSASASPPALALLATPVGSSLFQPAVPAVTLADADDIALPHPPLVDANLTPSPDTFYTPLGFSPPPPSSILPARFSTLLTSNSLPPSPPTTDSYSNALGAADDVAPRHDGDNNGDGDTDLTGSFHPSTHALSASQLHGHGQSVSFAEEYDDGGYSTSAGFAPASGNNNLSGYATSVPTAPKRKWGIKRGSTTGSTADSDYASSPISSTSGGSVASPTYPSSDRAESSSSSLSFLRRSSGRKTPTSPTSTRSSTSSAAAVPTPHAPVSPSPLSRAPATTVTTAPQGPSLASTGSPVQRPVININPSANPMATPLSAHHLQMQQQQYQRSIGRAGSVSPRASTSREGSTSPEIGPGAPGWPGSASAPPPSSWNGRSPSTSSMQFSSSASAILSSSTSTAHPASWSQQHLPFVLTQEQLHYATAYPPAEIRSFHSDKVRKTPISELDPSMLLGFLVKDRADWDDLRARVSRLSKPIFSIADEPPTWGDDDSDDMGLESVSGEDDLGDFPSDASLRDSSVDTHDPLEVEEDDEDVGDEGEEDPATASSKQPDLNLEDLQGFRGVGAARPDVVNARVDAPTLHRKKSNLLVEEDEDEIEEVGTPIPPNASMRHDTLRPNAEGGGGVHMLARSLDDKRRIVERKDTDGSWGTESSQTSSQESHNGKSLSSKEASASPPEAFSPVPGTEPESPKAKSSRKQGGHSKSSTISSSSSSTPSSASRRHNTQPPSSQYHHSRQMNPSTASDLPFPSSPSQPSPLTGEFDNLPQSLSGFRRTEERRAQAPSGATVTPSTAARAAVAVVSNRQGKDGGRTTSGGIKGVPWHDSEGDDF